MKQAGRKAGWPVLKSYDSAHLSRIALPLGGIGTGTVALGGRGHLCDWEVMNRPSKGFAPANTFFALFAQPAGGAPVTRALEGPLPEFLYEGDRGCKAPNHSLPRFRNCRFETAYPFGQVRLSDPDVPVDVCLEAFNPLVPGDVEASSIPAVVLRYTLKNRTAKRVDASICGNLQNFIGTDGTHGKPLKNMNTFRRGGKDGWKGVFMDSAGVDPASEFYGTMALSTDAATVSYRTAWPTLSWGNTLLDYWDDFSADGKLEPRDGADQDAPMASLAGTVTLPPRATRSITFLLTWRFPNRMTWHPADETPERVGNYYATRYRDAWDVVRKTAPKLAALEARTLAFVRAFCDSELPAVVKEAALFNVSTLRSQTCFRIESGEFFGWEGCDDTCGCCWGSCTHVWNYETATAFLFGALACNMRRIEFRHATDENGLMCFRVHIPLAQARKWPVAAADGQLGCIMKLYREWKLSGDTGMLKELWPSARRALAFCWIPGGWDGDQDGVMEGCQHNTMDVEYYGPNPQMQFWYLGALRAAEEMARYVGEAECADRCRRLFEDGSAWMDAHLFNGQYYEHEIRPPREGDVVAEGLQIGMGATHAGKPVLQLGAGCLVDQLVGQYMAHVCGLGYLAKRGHIRRTLKSIMRYNWRETMYGHFNHMRSYALNDESALLMASYPLGRRPEQPFPYYNEVMTGFEYTAATHMLYEGQEQAGLKVIAAIRRRYDGARRNPFDEAECGHHYGRAMASWTGVLALTGFQYCGVTQTMTMAAKPGTHFWSNGYAWGLCRVQSDKRGNWKATVQVIEGRLKLRAFRLDGVGRGCDGKAETLRGGQSRVFRVV